MKRLIALALAGILAATPQGCGASHEQRCENKGGTVHNVDVKDPKTGRIHRDYWCQKDGKITDRWS